MHRRAVELDGHSISYLEAGTPEAPTLVLVHGMLSDATTWGGVMPGLAVRGFRVIAIDILGHGKSAKPVDGEYTVTRFAELVADLMTALGIERATLAGHSLGGGTVIAVSHLYPERVDRLVLVASGGFGVDLHPVLRSATLPGARSLLRIAVGQRSSHLLSRPRLHRSLRVPPEAVTNLSRMGRALRDPDGMAAFFATLNTTINASGQRGSMVDRGYVDPEIPALIIWSERDPIIPVSHAHLAHAYLRRSRLELFPGASHEPHRRHPNRFVAAVSRFMDGPSRREI